MIRKPYFLPVLLLFSTLRAQITVSPTTLNFFTVYTDEIDSLTLTITNGGPTVYSVSDINLFHPAFMISDTAFDIPSGGSHDVKVYCDPRHNMRYADYLYIVPSNSPQPVAVFTYAFTRYRDTYYDVTHNKSNEELKAALKTLISTGTIDLGYNGIRDKMFMEVDNWKVNGKGSAVNKLACIYTDSFAVGYTSRSDAQTNYLYNTEHTFPQSFFGGVSPMLSDMHHLFPTKDFANSERANNPFGVVTSPTWTNSGSKSNGSMFEPHDVHKGNAARAMLYFVTRYQDYSNFCDSQEPTLYDWALTHLPTVWDSIRNEDIYALQNNRNPYVDHPEFLERIASVCSVDSGYTGSEAWWAADTLDFGSVPSGTDADGVVHFSNQGKSFLNLSGFSISDPAFTLVSTPSASIVTDSLESFTVRFNPPATTTAYTATMTVNTNDSWHPVVTIYLRGNSFPVANTPGSVANPVRVSPQPADAYLQVSGGSEITRVTLCDMSGRELVQHLNDGQDEIRLFTGDCPAGIYWLRMEDRNSVSIKKVIIAK